MSQTIQTNKILFIGCGNMGFTIAESIANAKLDSIEVIAIHDISPEVEKNITKDKRFIFYKAIKEDVSAFSHIFLAVKPNNKEEIFNTLKGKLTNKQIVISMMAGVKLETIQKGLGISKVVRTMPNLPAKISKGVTSYIVSDTIAVSDSNFVKDLLQQSGLAVPVDTEDLINSSTAISGSGSAYIFYFYEALFKSAVVLGFDEDIAKEMAIQTFEGAIELLKSSDLSPQEWIDKVTSKGGTTEAAIQSMEKNKVSFNIQQAIQKAYDKANELGK